MENFTPEGIRAQLSKILASSQLAGSPVLTEFLNFIVNEALDGRGHDLKEYTIGVSALKKEVSFNPQLDGIVRIHAGRLRRALKEYYYEEGKYDLIVISVPKGSYLPVFEPRANHVLENNNDLPASLPSNGSATVRLESKILSETEEETLPYIDPHLDGYSTPKHKPSVAVLPFKRIGQGSLLKSFVSGLGEFLSTELTQFDNLRVISYYSTDHISEHPLQIRKIGLLLDAEYLFTGSVQLLEDRLRVWVQLNSSDTEDQLWAHTFDEVVDSKSLPEFQAKVVDQIIGGVAGITGAISRHVINKNRKLNGEFLEDPTSTFSLAYWYTQYARNFDKTTVQKARKYYEKVIKDDPNNALALAFLSEIIAGEMLLLKTVDFRNDLGLYYGNKAIRIDPHCQQAYQAVAINKLMHHQNEDCVHTLEEGFKINPKSMDYKAAMGALMVFAGEFERGVKIMDSVILVHGSLFWWQVLSYSFYAYYRGFYMDALYWADRTEMDVIWIPIIKAASHAQLGQMESAKAFMDDIRSKFPDSSVKDKETLRKLFYSDTLINEILKGLAKI